MEELQNTAQTENKQEEPKKEEKKQKAPLYSFTKLDLYNQCPFRYYLQYVKGPYIQAPGIALELGGEIHSIEERIGNAIKDNKPIDYTALKNELIAKKYDLYYKFNEEYITPDKYGNLYDDKIYGYLDKGIYRLENYMRNHPELEIVGTEISINGFEFDGHKYRGSIDKLLRNKETGQYLIQDIKTYAAELEPAKVKAPMQLAIYTLAAAKKYNADIKDFVPAYDLPFCDTIQAAAVDKDGVKVDNWIDLAVDKVNSIFEGIANGEWKPEGSALCHWCPYCHTNKHQPKEAVGACPYCWLWTREDKKTHGLVKWTGIENYQRDVKEYLAKLQIQERW